MPRETAEQKAVRLIADGHLKVEKVLARLVVATCEGDAAIYHLGFDPRARNGAGEWRCTCPELKGKCSHLIALRLVTERKPERRRTAP